MATLSICVRIPNNGNDLEDIRPRITEMSLKTHDGGIILLDIDSSMSFHIYYAEADKYIEIDAVGEIYKTPLKFGFYTVKGLSDMEISSISMTFISEIEMLTEEDADLVGLAFIDDDGRVHAMDQKIIDRYNSKIQDNW